MTLTKIASEYIKQVQRDPAFTAIDETSVHNYLRSQNILAFKDVLLFQKNYSGLILTITNKPSATFSTQLFSNAEIESGASVDFLQIENRFFFYCGEHQTAQFWSVLDQHGKIYTYDNRTETVNIIFSSFEKFIENYAFEDLLLQNNAIRTSGFYEIADRQKIDSLVKNFERHDGPNDDHNKWCSGEGITLQTGKTWDRTANVLQVYGEREDDIERFIGTLKDSGAI